MPLKRVNITTNRNLMNILNIAVNVIIWGSGAIGSVTQSLRYLLNIAASWNTFAPWVITCDYSCMYDGGIVLSLYRLFQNFLATSFYKCTFTWYTKGYKVWKQTWFVKSRLHFTFSVTFTTRKLSKIGRYPPVELNVHYFWDWHTK